MDNIGREGEQVEFKENTTELEEGIISLSAMLNKSCFGKVFFGVRDNGDVVGMDIGKTTLKRISETVWRDIDPSVIPKLDVLRSSDGKEYISMEAHGNSRPYFVKGTAYIRCGEENRKISQHEAKMMLRSSEDCLSESESLNQELTFSELCLMLKKNGININDGKRLYDSFDLINSEKKFSIQAELLSDQNKMPLVVVVFNGLDRTCISYRKEYSGNSLLVEMKDVLDYVESLNENSVIVSSKRRVEEYLFNNDAFKEAWTNACVHNNWLSMIPPTIQIFDDRMEILSYGSIPYWLSMEDFFNGTSVPVNKSLMVTFIQTKMCERTGHGVPKIVESYGKEAFSFTSGCVRVTMKFSRYRYASSFRTISNKLTDKELTIYDVIRTDPTIKQDEIANLLGISKIYVSKTMIKLKERGIIKRAGSRKTGKWVIVKEIDK